MQQSFGFHKRAVTHVREYIPHKMYVDDEYKEKWMNICWNEEGRYFYWLNGNLKWIHFGSFLFSYVVLLLILEIGTDLEASILSSATHRMIDIRGEEIMLVLHFLSRGRRESPSAAILCTFDSGYMEEEIGYNIMTIAWWSI